MNAAIIVYISIILFLVWLLGSLGLFGLISYQESFESSKQVSNWSDNVDVIYFINLDHRKDRLEEFLQEMSKMGVPESKLVRIPGVYRPGKGDLGCSMSHCNALETFSKSSNTNCMIFEDDFEFIEDIDTINNMMSEFIQTNVEYDVCMLSINSIENVDTEWKFLKKVRNAQTASGYMVSKSFAPTLLANFQEGRRLLEDSYDNGKGDHIQGPYCIDQYWKRLQANNQWYVFDPKWGKQRDSFSDIQNGFVKMTV
jgi:hypothetical protein